MEGSTRKCPICGRPYKVYLFYGGDRSACPTCAREAEQNRGSRLSRKRDARWSTTDGQKLDSFRE